MSDDADFHEFARLQYDFVPILSVQYSPRMLADKARVADFDLVVDAICEAEFVVSCVTQLYVFLDEILKAMPRLLLIRVAEGQTFWSMS